MAAPSDVAPVISANNLRLRYGDLEVLHGLTFDVRHGETLVVLGGSGSGKSTLLRTLVGLEKPASGQVRIKGVDITKAGAREMDTIRKRIGLAFQGGALIGSMSVGGNIALPLLEHTTLKRSTIEVMVRIKLEQVGLSPTPTIDRFWEIFRRRRLLACMFRALPPMNVSSTSITPCSLPPLSAWSASRRRESMNQPVF